MKESNSDDGKDQKEYLIAITKSKSVNLGA